MTPTPRYRHRANMPMAQRPESSFSMLAARVRAIAGARAQGDEQATRGELRQLAAEAGRLAEQPVVFGSGGIHSRQRIAAEAEPSGRAGSS
jgi:hypothetical protein